MDANYEFSVPGTPQQYGVVERAFAMLYGRVYTMLKIGRHNISFINNTHVTSVVVGKFGGGCGCLL